MSERQEMSGSHEDRADLKSRGSNERADGSKVSRRQFSSADEYHNQAADYAIIDDYEKAYSIVKEGLLFFPGNVDLLADAVNYAKSSESNKYIKQLRGLGYSAWNWRAYTFVVNYLVELISNLDPSKEGIAEEKSEALKLAKEVAAKYCAAFPKDERAYKAMADVLALYDAGSSKVRNYFEKLFFGKIGGDCITVDFPVAQCCIAYADMLLASGDYLRAIQVCKAGIAGTAQEQPAANVAYLWYVKALSEDALIHLASINDPEEKVFRESREKVEMALQDYGIAYRLYSGSSRRPLIENIQNRCLILSEKAKVDNPLEAIANPAVATLPPGTNADLDLEELFRKISDENTDSES